MPPKEIWSLKEKKKLESLLNIYPLTAYKNIAKKLQTKDAKEVESMIERLKQSVKDKHKTKGLSRDVVKKAPLEEWLDVATDMVQFEDFDCSEYLSKVMLSIAHFEDFKTVKLEKNIGPDYVAIYRFISQILQSDRQEDLDILGSLESAILLDMLHGLMDVLSRYDTSVQRNVMRWKYQLMKTRNQCGHPDPELLRKAAENDFTEFVDELIANEDDTQRCNPRKSVISSHSAVCTNKSTDDSATPASTTTSNVNVCSNTIFEIPEVTASSSVNTFSGQTSEQMPASSSTTSTSTAVASTVSMSTSTTVINPVLSNTFAVPRHKPGRKSFNDKPETPITEIVLVMPPKNAKIINYSPRAKRPLKEREDGKYQALTAEVEAEAERSNDRDVYYDVQTVDSLRDKNRVRWKPAPADMELLKKKKQKIHAKQLKTYELLRKGKGPKTPSVHKKPRLYSLNPFCLPVSLLDIDKE